MTPEPELITPSLIFCIARIAAVPVGAQQAPPDSARAAAPVRFCLTRDHAIMRALPLILALIAALPAVAQQTPPDSGRVYELHEVEVLPRPQNAADFSAALAQGYPPHLRGAGVGGVVQVAFVVGPDGVPGDVRVLSTPDSSFDAPSTQAVSLLRFTPAQVGGHPVAVRVEQPITWRAAPPENVAATVATAESTDVYELSRVEELPRLLNPRAFRDAMEREYPHLAGQLTTRGTVQVRFRVERDGTVSSPTVTHFSNRILVEPTLRAVQVLRFVPGKVNGRPVRTWVEQPVSWTDRRPVGAPLPDP